jgi:hypothetical protein
MIYGGHECARLCVKWSRCHHVRQFSLDMEKRCGYHLSSSHHPLPPFRDKKNKLVALLLHVCTLFSLSLGFAFLGRVRAPGVLDTFLSHRRTYLTGFLIHLLCLVVGIITL